MAISFLNTGTFSDNSKLKIGSGGDLEIFHDASDTYLENYTGEFIFTQHLDNGIMRFKSDDGSGGTTTYFFLDGATSETNDLITTFPDNSVLTFGTGRDLKIWHDASHSYIRDAGTGSLIIRATDLQINNSANTANMITGTDGGAVTLYCNGAVKAATATSGFSVTGKQTISTIDEIGSDTDKFLMSDSGEVKYVTGANLRSYIGAGTGSGTVTSIATSSPITGGTITGTGTIGIDDATGTTPGAAALDAGTGISLSDSSGVYTVTNSGVTSIVAGTNVTISGATGAVTVNSSDQYSGTVTSVAVTVGTGLDVSGSPITSSGTIDIDLDLSEFTDMTSAMTGTDEFIVLDSSAERRKAANEIGLSIFDNDSGFVTSSGVTTIACSTAAVTNGSSDLVTGNDVYDFVNGSYLPLDGSDAMEGDLDMDGYDIDNVVNLELNGSAAGAIVLDTALSATSVKGCGTIINFGSTSVTQGSYYYWKSSSAWELTDADTEAKTNGLIAYARFTGTASTGGMLLNGIIHDASHGFTIGSPLYISTTAGAISNTAPSGSGDSVRVVGYAIDSNHIYFCPDNTWVKVS